MKNYLNNTYFKTPKSKSVSGLYYLDGSNKHILLLRSRILSSILSNLNNKLDPN